MNYYMFLAPKEGEPYRFVAGFRRHWLFWRRVEYSDVPVTVSVSDYAELDGLTKAVEKETGRGVKVCLAEKMDECCGDDRYWAIATLDGRWYTGRLMKHKRSGRKEPETVGDLYGCQLWVREQFAFEALRTIQRDGFDGVIHQVYIRTENIFRKPCIVILCVNKRNGRVQYLKSDGGGKFRLQYTNWLDEAMLIYPEDCEAMYERLTTQHKAHSFTMIVRPNADIPASEIRQHEKELVQRIAYDFKLSRHEAKKD